MIAVMTTTEVQAQIAWAAAITMWFCLVLAAYAIYKHYEAKAKR